MQPSLRFPEFKDKWEKKRLGNLSSQSMYGIGASAVEFDKKNVYVRITDIDEDTRRIIGDYTSPDNIDEKYLLEKNDILFARTGASTGKTYIHSKFNETLKYYFAGFLIKFKIKDNYSSKFIYQYTFTEMYKNWVKVMSVRSGQPGINSEEYSKLSLYIPKKEEQEKIGIFFSKLDQQIELEEKRIELLEQQKRGYMQKIFSQGLRFKDEEGNYYKEWDTKQLKDVLEFSNKRTTNENEYPVLTSSRQGLILQSDYYKDGKTFAESNIGYFILPKNYITYRSRSDDGIFKFNLNQIIDVGIISKYYPVFKGINANQYYLTLHLNYRLKKEYIKYATGTSQLVLSQKNLQNIQTKLPSYEEQTKIANFLSELDKLIEKQSDKVELLKDRKKGLLQKMFV